jgi:hypothetical protein
MSLIRGNGSLSCKFNTGIQFLLYLTECDMGMFKYNRIKSCVHHEWNLENFALSHYCYSIIRCSDIRT